MWDLAEKKNKSGICWFKTRTINNLIKKPIRNLIKTRTIICWFTK
jgi:hypothetical protein